ncbi:NAD-dependent epimerase/dehydratase family protein [Ruegeria atlantica]|uniref:NAD-dependent epimerase/dehydratase family protein n=1 Tax=Ruegeria atlantica TaxID=81569 RepID=UPI002494F241|nr:NAD-dependent epimerase/dehydratase family protein [Ruegeria atlantica]
MFTIGTSKPVMVIGATGFVAGWIVKDLLEAGAIVHARVRNPDNTDKVEHLLDIARAAPAQLRLFKADLLTLASYAEAMEGCGVTFHTASPFTIYVKDPQNELIDPAVNGTRNVLGQANKTESVWNVSSSIDHNAYSYSKTLAEKKA